MIIKLVELLKVETAFYLKILKNKKNNDEFSHLRGAINSHLAVDKVIKFCKENGIKRLIPVHIGNSTRKEVKEALQNW